MSNSVLVDIYKIDPYLLDTFNFLSVSKIPYLLDTFNFLSVSKILIFLSILVINHVKCLLKQI